LAKFCSNHDPVLVVSLARKTIQDAEKFEQWVDLLHLFQTPDVRVPPSDRSILGIGVGGIGGWLAIVVVVMMDGVIVDLGEGIGVTIDEPVVKIDSIPGPIIGFNSSDGVLADACSLPYLRLLDPRSDPAEGPSWSSSSSRLLFRMADSP
nr:hypothetical protein [Tanacetum cinerariifolium]